MEPFESKAVLLDLGSPMVGSIEVFWQTRGWSATLRTRLPSKPARGVDFALWLSRRSRALE